MLCLGKFSLFSSYSLSTLHLVDKKSEKRLCINNAFCVQKFYSAISLSIFRLIKETTSEEEELVTQCIRGFLSHILPYEVSQLVCILERKIKYISLCSLLHLNMYIHIYIYSYIFTLIFMSTKKIYDTPRYYKRKKIPYCLLSND